MYKYSFFFNSIMHIFPLSLLPLCTSAREWSKRDDDGGGGCDADGVRRLRMLNIYIKVVTQKKISFIKMFREREKRGKKCNKLVGEMSARI